MTAGLLDPAHMVNELARLIEAEKTRWREPADGVGGLRSAMAELYYEHEASAVRFGDEPRFLVDVCAFRGEQMEMAAAIEFDPLPARTLEAFSRLIHLKARLKVLFCDSPRLVTARLAPVASLLASYPDHRRSEEYVIFNWRGNRGVVSCHRWRPERDGTIHSVRFTLVENFPRVVDSDKWGRFRHKTDAWLASLIDIAGNAGS